MLAAVVSSQGHLSNYVIAPFTY